MALFTLFLAQQPEQHSQNVTQIALLPHCLSSLLRVKVSLCSGPQDPRSVASPLPLTFLTSRPSGPYSDDIHVASHFSFLHSTLKILILFLCIKDIFGALLQIAHLSVSTFGALLQITKH